MFHYPLYIDFFSLTYLFAMYKLGLGSKGPPSVCKDLLDLLMMKVIGQLWVGLENLFMHKVLAHIKGCRRTVMDGS
jgi:hypothetical protein